MNSLKIMNPPKNDYACAEAINTLCTNLTFSGTSVRKIMVTSCHANEGKSFLSFNIVLNMARLGKRVVFVDADLRRSMINKTYKVTFTDEKHRFGLTHYLAGMTEAEEIVYSTDMDGVYIVPVGHKVSNSLQLLSSERLQLLLASLGRMFDYVIVDAPPIGVLIDGAQIAKFCDGTLMVVNYNSVHRQELIDAKNQLEQTGCPILGVALNEVEYDGYIGYDYHYKSYYTRYDSYAVNDKSRHNHKSKKK